MQTTLRINDEIYREAKAEAAREGITLTKFLESALRLKLRKEQNPTPGRPHFFRVHTPELPCDLSNEEIRRIADEEQEKYDFAKLGIEWKEPS